MYLNTILTDPQQKIANFIELEATLPNIEYVAQFLQDFF